MKISSNNTPNVGEGVLMPHLQHRFRFLFGNIEPTAAKQISSQTIRIELNYKHQTGTVIIAQPLAGGAMHEVLWRWMDNKGVGYIIALDGVENPHYVFKLSGMQCTNHTIRFDYAESDPVEHRIEFTFDGLTMANPEKGTWATNSE